MFRNETKRVREEDKLADLFRNRAELKKEFAALRDEKYELQESVRLHIGDAARAEQKLNHLEILLLDPHWVHNIAAFYQLRNLAMNRAAKLEGFAEKLKQQQEKQRNSAELVEWSRQRREKKALIEDNLNEHRLSLQLLQDQLASDRQRLQSMGTLMKLFGGRALAREIQAMVERIDAANLQEEEMLEDLQSTENMEPPSLCGLDVATKRSLNLKIISFAQHLYLQFDDKNLLHLAKEAIERSVGSIKYGTRQECALIFAALEKNARHEQPATGDADVLRKRLQLISQCAEYEDAEDAVPLPASVATVFAIDAAGKVTELDVDIVGENYFGIAKVLSR